MGIFGFGEKLPKTNTPESADDKKLTEADIKGIDAVPDAADVEPEVTEDDIKKLEALSDEMKGDADSVEWKDAA